MAPRRERASAGMAGDGPARCAGRAQQRCEGGLRVVAAMSALVDGIVHVVWVSM